MSQIKKVSASFCFSHTRRCSAEDWFSLHSCIMSWGKRKILFISRHYHWGLREHEYDPSKNSTLQNSWEMESFAGEELFKLSFQRRSVKNYFLKKNFSRSRRWSLLSLFNGFKPLREWNIKNSKAVRLMLLSPINPSLVGSFPSLPMKSN